MTAIIIIAILAVLLFWGIGVQRKLVNQEELCKNAMSQIGVQQNSRWDALTALVELVKSYNEHEYNTLKDVISMRQPLGRNSTAAAFPNHFVIQPHLASADRVAARNSDSCIWPFQFCSHGFLPE